MKQNKVLILICSVLYGTLQVFGQANFMVKHINPNYNNTQVEVSSIAQDSLGNIWMSNKDGILKYNGHSYILTKNKDVFPAILPGDKVDKFYSSSQNEIWVKSKEGLLTMYDAVKGEFLPLDKAFDAPVSTIKTRGKDIIVATENGDILTYDEGEIEHLFTVQNIDFKGNAVVDLEIIETSLYVSTSHGKIYIYSFETKETEELVGLFTDYPENIILQADSENRLWIGTEAHGLFVYDVYKEKFVQDSFFFGDIDNITNELFFTMYFDGERNIYAGTDGGGLYIINSGTGKVNVYKYKYPREFTLSSNTIVNINKDASDNIWLVTNYGDVNVIPKASNNINYHSGSVQNIPLRVLSIYRSSQNDLWIGTDGNGLVKIQKNQKEEEFFNDINNNFYIQSITEDNNANMWFGTYRNGLWKYENKTQRFTKIPVKNKQNQLATDIRSVYKDSKGRLWVGSNISLNIYTDEGKLLASFNNKSHGLNGSNFESIIEDQNKSIWVGQVNSGLFKFIEDSLNVSNSTFKNYPHLESTSIRVRDMSLGKANELWIIDEKNNLLKFNTKTEQYQSFKDFLPNRKYNFNAVITQDESNLWISSNNGIHNLNFETNLIQSFYTSDGLQENRHMLKSKYKDEEGNIYFGSEKGIHYFDPKILKKNTTKGHLFINLIEILNQPAKDIIPEQISSDIFNTTQLDLESNQSSFSVKFSAINNILSSNYFYSYKLKGFDEDWKISQSEGVATYTNLPPGKYTLVLKANEINKPTKELVKNIAITVAPPLWQTNGAYLAYFIIFAMLSFSTTRWYIVRKKLLINKISRKKEKELHKTKMNFFTKMSHEIQTPITLILSPIENMIERAECNGDYLLKERLNLIANNARRLSRIGKELTLARDKSMANLKLQASLNNLYENISTISLSFKELARIKKIDFDVTCPKDLNTTWYDKEKLEHILYNIIDNAFKFTPKEGRIHILVKTSKNKKQAKVLVSDTGVGISKQQMENIFKLFYRASQEVKGMGVGLALTKELVDIQKGKIKVRSSSSKGTTFIIKIPITEDSYKAHEKITPEKDFNRVLKPLPTSTEKNLEHDDLKKTILIVEDNFELQNFLKQLLSDEYNILTAEDGAEGFEVAKRQFPDIILSDIMMPNLNGVELCKKLVKDKQTKHIPIIVLTAKNSTHAKLEALESGAIEFLQKPFNIKELQLKIKNNLTRRDQIIYRYQNTLTHNPHLKNERSQDQIFLEKLNKIVNDNLNNTNFRIEELAEQINMSHSSLYRKCSSLTGMSVVDYIKQIRLKKAAILLVKYGYSISEVAYLVGFNNPKYFSNCFKAFFNKTPKKFKSEVLAHQSIDSYLKTYNIFTDVLEGDHN